MIEPGTYTARATEIDFGEASNGTPQIAVLFEAVDTGETITWYGYLTEKAAKYAVQALRTMGWQGDDLSALDIGDIQEEVSIVVDTEEYDGQTRTKVKWVNRPGGLALKQRMEPADRKRFADKFKGLCMTVPKVAPSSPSTPSSPTPTNGGRGPAAMHDDDVPPF